MTNDIRRPTRAEIDLGNLEHNFKSIRSFVGTDAKFLAVVKANAYGHGAVECSRVLEREGADYLGVAIPEEGLELRAAGISLPILCLGGVWPGQEESLLVNRIIPVLFDRDSALRLNHAAGRLGLTATAHVKIDTGMGRLGVPCGESAEFARFLRGLPHLRIDGLMSHFAAADDPNESDFTHEQIARFQDALHVFSACGHDISIFDLANSPGAVCYPESRKAMVRIGGILYGLGGDVLPQSVPQPEIRPVMSVVSDISLLKWVPPDTSIGYSRTFRASRESLIASIPIGYNDGVPRALSNCGQVVIRGKRAPIVGRVSMDWITVDVTEIEGVSVRDNVYLIGPERSPGISAVEIAAKVGTISYEVTCGIGSRVPRIFLMRSPRE